MVKKVLLIALLILAGAGIYLFPRMLNQRSYDRYLLIEPDMDPDSAGYPLLLYLHGSGERGRNLDKLRESEPLPFMQPGNGLPFLVLIPQCDPNDSWHPKYLVELLDEITRLHPVDTNRIYMTGLSMGGRGTWELAQYAPRKFAAIAPVCGRSSYPLEQLEAIRDLPVWVFHGKKDRIVPYEESERLVNRLRAYGGEVKFTLYPDVGHAAWEPAYSDPELYAWLLSKRRKATADWRGVFSGRNAGVR